jgi:hypothetical protein
MSVGSDVTARHTLQLPTLKLCYTAMSDGLAGGNEAPHACSAKLQPNILISLAYR